MHEAIREITPTKTANLMIFGMFGVGKTVFAATGGPKTLILRPPIDHTDSILTMGWPAAQRPKEWVVRDWPEMDEVSSYLLHEGDEWDWVWLDSISLFQDSGLDNIWDDTITRKPSRKEFGPDKSEYGVNMWRLAEWVRQVVWMDTFNFGITAHPELLVDPEDGEERLMPWVQGKKMSARMCGYMNTVGYLDERTHSETNEVYRLLTVHKTDRFYAKDQFGIKDGKILNPTVPKFMAAIKAARTPAAAVKKSSAAKPATTKRRRKSA